jgi:uracil-DNA glycosylase
MLEFGRCPCDECSTGKIGGSSTGDSNISFMTLSSLGRLVEQIRAEQKLGDEVPGFDPLNGNENARFLFVLEAPGPKSVASKVISFDNPDPTASNLRSQLTTAGINRKDVALWNVVPWYIGNKKKTKIRGATASDVKQGVGYLSKVIALMPQLECVVLVGSAARQAHVFLSYQTNVRILSCHHTSATAQNTLAGAADDNLAVFRYMLASSK